jgi:hypothetical protein
MLNIKTNNNFIFILLNTYNYNFILLNTYNYIFILLYTYNYIFILLNTIKIIICFNIQHFQLLCSSEINYVICSFYLDVIGQKVDIWPWFWNLISQWSAQLFNYVLFLKLFSNVMKTSIFCSFIGMLKHWPK